MGMGFWHPLFNWSSFWQIKRAVSVENYHFWKKIELF